ncbi:hypothetical protein CEXT_357701 [Caerostris extrusa]|uniref:Uncharacterized protein n=1 Tax=Caerostris extrusa TaxID=172846 RepID=A0AAV4M647_CAEEX|nr:hypothetical protein CEXT_357701 [Caerostris extrusa]
MFSTGLQNTYPCFTSVAIYSFGYELRRYKYSGSENYNRASGIGDWFLIYLLSKNMDPDAFTVMMMILAGKLQNDVIFQNHEAILIMPSTIIYE